MPVAVAAPDLDASAGRRSEARVGTFTFRASPGQTSDAAPPGRKSLQAEYSPLQAWAVESSSSASAAFSQSVEVRGGGEVTVLISARTPSSPALASAAMLAGA